MLKIKDNVDLKELENFGLVFKPSTYKENEGYVFYTSNKFHASYIRLSVNVLSRQIRLSSCKESVSILFDLITAGLVEKV